MKITVKADNNGSKLSGYAALAFTAISIILSVLVFIVGVMDEKTSLIEALIAGPLGGFLFGGLIPGFLRAPEKMKKHKRSLLFFPFGWIYFSVVAFMIPACSGWFYMLKDLKTYVKFEKGE